MVKVIKGIHSIDFSDAKNHGMELWFLDCLEGVILIDTGMREPVLKMMEDELKLIGKDWKDIKLVLITHKHRDHISNLAKIKELTGAPVMAHIEEAPLIKSATGVNVEGLAHKEKLPFCGGIEIIHVPGHTEGNSSYYLPKWKAIIAGDTIFGDENSNLIAPPEKYCLDVKQATREIKRLLNYDFDMLLYTHGKDISKDAKKEVQMLVEKTQ
jgi:glyoxylase-like metal-dependent hydrolase (beta-lactamase superfamily II)